MENLVAGLNSPAANGGLNPKDFTNAPGPLQINKWVEEKLPKPLKIATIFILNFCPKIDLNVFSTEVQNFVLGLPHFVHHGQTQKRN